MAAGVDESRACGGGAGRIEPRRERLDRAGRHDRVAVEQQHQRRRAAADADVVRGAEADVAIERDDVDAGMRGPPGMGALSDASVERSIDSIGTAIAVKSFTGRTNPVSSIPACSNASTTSSWRSAYFPPNASADGNDGSNTSTGSGQQQS